MFKASEKQQWSNTFHGLTNASTPDSIDGARDHMVELLNLTIAYREIATQIAESCAATVKAQFNAAGFREDLDAHVQYFLDPIFSALPENQEAKDDAPSPYGYGYDPAVNRLSYCEVAA